ncbi:hypothetical protein PHAVU_004G140000 [Phaseolus vulgaris]|uniref:Uncharacterized protein n=1 Tax=Phaseolus vulgaris TaxID=3885 RepID=V7C5I2_PHAVU|nr:hypothetical protein PHAVU_004G140000g [Phaseolus vulgaris]ESW24550.1 hypothetical protein PHAVU_004G140000g [Phaseolus vulgaris]
MSSIKSIHVIKDGYNQEAFSLAVKDGSEFIQAKGGRSIVGREDNYGNPRLFNCLHKCCCYFFSAFKFVIIKETVNSLVTKSFEEIGSEIITRVFPSKAQEHIIGESMGT